MKSPRIAKPEMGVTRIFMMGIPIVIGALLWAFAAANEEPEAEEIKITEFKSDVGPNGEKFLNITFARRDDPANSIYDIEVSGDLRQWRTLGPDEFEEQAGEPGQPVRVRLKESVTDSTLRYYRINVRKEALQFVQAPLLPAAEPGGVTPQPIDISGATDVTAKTQVQFSGMFHNRRTFQSTVNATIKNTSATAIPNPIYLVITGISEPSVHVANANDTTLDGKPLFNFSGQVPGGTLDPGETTSIRPLVFNNPSLKPFTVTVSVLQGSAAPSGAVTLRLTTDGNHSVIMKSEVAPVTRIPHGVGEELTVTVNDSFLPTEVQLDQVQLTGGRGQIYFGISGTALSTTVTTSGGSPNQAKVIVRYAQTSGFKGDIKIRALIGAVVQGQKLVTAIVPTVSPKCVYSNNQSKNGKVQRFLTINPAVGGVRFDMQAYAAIGDAAHPSHIGTLTTTISPTDTNGISLMLSEHLGFQGYFVFHVTPARSGPGPLSALSSSGLPNSPSIDPDYEEVKVSDVLGGPETTPGAGSEYQYTCPNCSSVYTTSPPPADGSSSSSVDPSDGEKKNVSHDLSIPGRGLDYEFTRAYYSFSYRRRFDRNDFGENWTYSYADELLVKDGSGADADANYVYFRGGGTAYMFVRTAPGVWSPETQQFTRLRINPASGDFEIRDQSGTVRVFHDFSDSSPQNVNGRLKEMRDRNDNVMRFLYDQPAGLSKRVLTTVVDTMGRSILYRYYMDSANPGQRGRLMEIEDYRRDNAASGRKVKFHYDREGNLVAVSSPSVQGTPDGNDFPLGKTFRYRYIVGTDLPGSLTPDQRNQLLHKLIRIWYPNEVGNNPTVDPADSLAREAITYEMNPSHPFFGFVTRYTIGGLNANGVPAGGTILYTYTDLNPTRAMPPGVNLDPRKLIHLPSHKVQMQDRNGNRAEAIFSGGNKMLEYSVLTRGLRAGEAAKYTTTYTYTQDRLLARRTMPEGNFTVWTYDQQNPDRFQQGNVLQVMRVPDSKRGGDQGQLTTRFVYDPVYNQPCLIIEPRGTDASFVPPFGGPASPMRYATSYTFDYQEGLNLDSHIQRLADVLDVSLQRMKQIIGHNEEQVEEALGFPPGSIVLLGKGDVNGDGLTDQIHGNHLQKFSPTVNLLPGSNQAAIEGDTTQEIVERFVYNKFGQMLSRVDPERNVHTAKFFAETDPDGDGTPTSAPADGRVLDSSSGGYLQETAADTAVNPLRNNRMNPAPVNIRTRYAYDDVGNIVSTTNGRGIRTDHFVNELDQIVKTTRAAAVPAVDAGDPPEPLALTAFGYLERITYDFNDNVIRRQVEDRGDTSNTGGFVDAMFKYDILDQQIEMTQEVDVDLSLITRFRYDRNANRVMTIHPAGNATSAVYDERDLLFTSTRGALTRPVAGLFAASDSTSFNRPGGAGTIPSTSTFSYDANRNLVESVDAENNGGSKSSIAGGLGDVTRFTYDGYDRRRTVTDPLGNRTSQTYDPASNVVRVRQDGDPVDDVPGAAEDKTLAASEFIHDELSRGVATHRLLFQTPDVSPARTPVLSDLPEMDLFAPYLADASTDTAPVPGASGITVIGRITGLTEYDRQSRVTFNIEDDLDANRTDYDGASRVIRTVDPALNNGFSAGVFNPAALAGNVIETAYDDNSNPIELLETDVTDLAGVSAERFRTTFFYDALDRVQTAVDNIGQAEDYRYDSRGNLVARADASGPVTARALSRRGLGSSAAVLINDFGNITRTRYDGLSRTLETEAILTVSGLGDGVNIGASFEGVLTTVPTPDPAQSSDGLISTYYAYDANSQLLCLRDDNGNTTGYIYDNQNRQRVERKGLFEAGTTCTLAGGDTGRFNTPLRGGAPVVDTEPDGTDITYTYDRDGNAARTLDEAGNVLAYTYDALNRRTQCNITPAAGFIGTTRQTWQYDGQSRLTRCFDNNEPAPVDDDIRIAYFYDSISRKVEEQQQIGSLSAKAVSFNYELDCGCAATGLPSLCTYPDGRQVKSEYDRLDRLVSRADANGAGGFFSPIGNYAYIGKSRVATLTYQNGTRLTHLGGPGGTADTGFDRLRRIVNHPWEKTDAPRGSGALIVGFKHQSGDAVPVPLYDRANNKRIEYKTHDPVNSEQYKYDSAYRLTSKANGAQLANQRGVERGTFTDVSRTSMGAANINFSQDWDLDGLGNWPRFFDNNPAPETRTHSDINEIVTRNGTTLAHDKNGNLTDDGTLLLFWDALNRLQKASRKFDSAQIADYTYDCHNRRLRKVTTSGGVNNDPTLNARTDFYYDGWRVLEEQDESDAVTQQYTYGNYLDEVWTIDNRVGNSVAILNDGTAGQRKFYHANTLYHVYGITDEVGGLIEAYQYDAYGKQTVIVDGNDGDAGVNFGANDVRTVGANSAVANPYMYTGQRFDPETGNLYYKNRYFGTGLGRFLSRDAIGYEGGINLYEYVVSQPTMAFDSLGLNREYNKCVAEAMAKYGACLMGSAASGPFAPALGSACTAILLLELSKCKDYHTTGVIPVKLARACTCWCVKVEPCEVTHTECSGRTKTLKFHRNVHKNLKTMSGGATQCSIMCTRLGKEWTMQGCYDYTGQHVLVHGAGDFYNHHEPGKEGPGECPGTFSPFSGK